MFLGKITLTLPVSCQYCRHTLWTKNMYGHPWDFEKTKKKKTLTIHLFILLI